MQLFGCLQHLETGAAAHLEVADNDIEKALVEFLDGGIAVWRFFDLVTGLGDRLPESTAQRIVIVSNENAAHTVALVSYSASRLTDTGSVTRISVPPPGTVRRAVCPSCGATIFRTVARPRPDP